MRNIEQARYCVGRQLARKDLVDKEQRMCLEGMLTVLNWIDGFKGPASPALRHMLGDLNRRDVDHALACVSGDLSRRDLSKGRRACLVGMFSALNWIDGDDELYSKALQHLIDGRHVILRLTGTPLPPGKAPILFVSPWGEVAESVLTS